MSVLEFITDNGDTLFIKKESEITGKAGILYRPFLYYHNRRRRNPCKGRKCNGNARTLDRERTIRKIKTKNITDNYED